MSDNPLLKEFIEQNIDLIDAGDFDTLYQKLPYTNSGYNYRVEPSVVTRLFLDIGIDPLDELTYVPEEYGKYLDFQTLYIPEKIDLIKPRAFYSCKKLETVEISEGVKMIDRMAFSQCPNLKQIILPKSLEHIGRTAFFGSGELESIYYKGTVEDWDWVDQDRLWISTPNAMKLPIICSDGVAKARVEGDS